MSDALSTLRPVSEALDRLGIAMCVFDDADCTLLWNRTFLSFFPEHAGHVHAGEHYRENLRRFYRSRLADEELPSIDRYIEEGVERHRTQQAAYAFEHRGLRLWVTCLALPGAGRVRIWKAETIRPDDAAAADPQTPGAAAIWPADRPELFEHVADGVMVANVDDRIVWVNDAFVVLYGLPDRSSATGLDFAAVYRLVWQGQAGTEDARCTEGLSILAENLRFAGAPFEVPLPGERWSRVIEKRGSDGKRYFIHVDISVLKRQQRQLVLAEQRARQSEALLRDKSNLLEATLEHMEQGVMMVNAGQVVEVCNRRAMELLDLPAELMRSRPSFEQVLAWQWAHDEFARTPPDILAFVRAGGIRDRAHSYDRTRPDGRVLEIQSVPIAGGGVLRTYTDITERKRAEERIRHVARHDGLTSLVNREVFLEHLASAARNVSRAADGFAVHFIDLDGFKPINDRYGHVVGDKALARVAGRLRAIAREADVVARMGGDEFAILQHRVERADSALSLAYRLLDGVRQAMDIESHSLHVGASIGIALCFAAGDPDTLLRNADHAMYAAKSAGRNQVRLHDHDEIRPLEQR